MIHAIKNICILYVTSFATINTKTDALKEIGVAINHTPHLQTDRAQNVLPLITIGNISLPHIIQQRVAACY